MAFILKADGSAGDAYAEIDLGSDQPEVWITLSVRFSADTLAEWISSTFSGYMAKAWNPAHDTFLDYAVIDTGEWRGGYGQNPVPAPASDVWQIIEIHHENGGTVSLMIDGMLIYTDTDTLNEDTRFVAVGLELAPGDPLDVVYIDNVKIGTTQLASDLFADDFEDGTLDAWTTTSGDVEVISSTFPPPTILDPQGVCIALTADTLSFDVEYTRLDDPDGYNVATSWSIHRGKASGFDKTGTGIASIAFADSDGILDPTNMTGPFVDGGTATLLDPMRQVVIAMQNPVTGTWWPLFTGFLSSQQHDMDMWTDAAGVDRVTWECADAFDVLAAQC